MSSNINWEYPKEFRNMDWKNPAQVRALITFLKEEFRKRGLLDKPLKDVLPKEDYEKVKKILEPQMYCIQCGNVHRKSLICNDCEKKNEEKRSYKKTWGIKIE